MKQIFVILTMSLFAVNVSAHSGGTDSNGCHENTSTGEYHCHNDDSLSKHNEGCGSSFSAVLIIPLLMSARRNDTR